MYSPKVYNTFHNLGEQFSNICREIDAFMSTISEWADNLGGIVEQEFKESKGSDLFSLPKTPSVKKTRNRNAKNAVVSKCSVINSTFLFNETTNLDSTISLRTRGALKAATSKLSQFSNVDICEPHPTEKKTRKLNVKKSDEANVSDATFLMPKATTRTKPVLKNAPLQVEVPEPSSSESQNSDQHVINTSNESLEKELTQTQVSEMDINSTERSSKRRISRSLSSNTAEQSTTKETAVVINETPERRSSRRKTTRNLNESPVEGPAPRKVFRALSGSPVIRSSSTLDVSRSPRKSLLVRSSSLKNTRTKSSSPVVRISENNDRRNVSVSQECKPNTSETLCSSVNKTVTIKKESTPGATSTFVTLEEAHSSSVNDEEKTSSAKEDGFFRLSKTSTPVLEVEKTPLAYAQNTFIEADENAVINSGTKNIAESIINTSVSVLSRNTTEKMSEEIEVPKKKRKLKKDEEVKENLQGMADTVRITRTKSKAIKKMMEENENKQADLSAFAKKLLSKAKLTSSKKNQLVALLECNSSTPKNYHGQTGSSLLFGNLTASKSKYHLLLSSSKKLKTPQATLPTSAVKIVKASSDKDALKPKVASRDSSAENVVRNNTKSQKDDLLEREIKLKSKKEKEEEVALKRKNVIKTKQEELRRKNELKHQMAMKQREKLEQEKYNNMLQSEKEKEERHKLILQERKMKLKEEVHKKKMLTQQKIAETVERRRLEEEARIAKLKEMEAEEQKLALEKQREQERLEKRAQERLAQKKAREEYEMQLKQELEVERLKSERLLTAKKCLSSASKLQSSSKRQRFNIIGDKREWDYKPRNENDYGLEDEHSDLDSEDEKSYDKAKPAMPWGKKIIHGKSPVVKVLTLEMLCEFMPCYQKSPDIHKMFKMTPSKRIKRSSSAIWNTPSS